MADEVFSIELGAAAADERQFVSGSPAPGLVVEDAQSGDEHAAVDSDEGFVDYLAAPPPVDDSRWLGIRDIQGALSSPRLPWVCAVHGATDSNSMFTKGSRVVANFCLECLADKFRALGVSDLARNEAQ